MNERKTVSADETGLTQRKEKSLNLSMKPREGFAEVEDVRRVFEQSVTETPALCETIRLDVQEKEGVFIGYKYHQTDVLWVGFSLGIRCCERLEKMGHPSDAATFARLNVVPKTNRRNLRITVPKHERTIASGDFSKAGV